MCRIEFSRCGQLAVGIVLGLAMSSAAQANDTGVVRISDRSSQPVIRAQSPEDASIEPTNCETVGAPCTSQPYCPPHGICGPSDGLVIGTSPTCSYDDDRDECEDYGYYENCESCRDFGHNADCQYCRGCQSGLPGIFDCPYCDPGQSCPHCRGTGYCFEKPSRCRVAGNRFIDGFANGCDRILGFLHDKMGLEHSGGDGVGVPLVGHYVLHYPVDPSYFDGRDGQVYAAPGYGGPVSVPLAPVVRHTYNYGWGVPSSRLTPISHPIPPTP